MKPAPLSRFLLVLLLLPFAAGAQELGVQGGLVLGTRFKPEGASEGAPNALMKGLRLEGDVLFQHGEPLPVLAAAHVGVTYFLPQSDTVSLLFEVPQQSTTTVLSGRAYSSTLRIDLGFSYELPQDANPLLFLHYGMGFGFIRSQYWWKMEGHDRSLHKSKVYMDDQWGLRSAANGGLFKGYFGAFYEFEHFRLAGQAEINLVIGSFPSVYDYESTLHANMAFLNTTFGVFVPLKRE